MRGRASSVSLSGLCVLALVGCHDPEDYSPPMVVGDDTDLPDTTADVHPGVTVVDHAVESGFQNWETYGHFNRGRSCIVGDYDLDGMQDIVLGAPSDESFVMLNRSEIGGPVKFEAGPLLTEDSLTWSMGAADYDNDGDLDIFQSLGGIEGNEFNRLWRNEMIPSGDLTFTDTTDLAGVKGPKDRNGEFQEAPNGGVTFGDVDNDGDIDMFVSEDVWPLRSYDRLRPIDWQGYDLLFQNNGDGTFTDIAAAVGLRSQEPTRHSHFLDLDNDFDLDIYENNFTKSKHIWMNRLDVGNGLTFSDVTQQASIQEDGDMRYPLETFSSGTADFNNDGWEDIISFVRGYPSGGPYLLGHTIFLNVEGTGFVDVTAFTNLNNPFEPGLRNHAFNGVMGSTPTDMNSDGLVDVWIGNGGPESGQNNQLFIAKELREVDYPGVGTLLVPWFENWTDLIDFPAPEDPDAIAAGIEYPPYPYRGHGACVADFNQDGTVEIASMQGGTYLWGGEISREPNRLFEIQMPTPSRWLAIHPVGNGTDVTMTPVGTRFEVTVVNAQGDEWTVRNRLRGSVGFSASTGMDVFFGLKDATEIVEVTAYWPDGHVQTVDNVELDQRLEVRR